MGKAKALTEKEMFCLDAWMSNGKTEMAYLLSRENPPKPDTTAKSIMKSASRWINDPKIVEYIENRRRIDYAKVEEDTTKRKTKRSREDAVEELNALISATTDPKIRGDLLLKLSDLNKWKKSDIQEEEKHLQYYIPLTFDRCRELTDYLERYYAEKDEGRETRQ